MNNNNNNTENLPYRENVCLIIYKSPQEIFIGEREGSPGIWQLPQGGVEPGQTLEENVVREASEELGADSELFEITAKLAHTHKYIFSNPPAYAKGKYCGQQQTFWLVRYKGQDCNIKLDRFEAEFRDWKWVSIDDIRNQVEARRWAGYEGALKEILANHWMKG